MIRISVLEGMNGLSVFGFVFCYCYRCFGVFVGFCLVGFFVYTISYPDIWHIAEKLSWQKKKQTGIYIL